MNQSTIRLIVGIMAAALIGLILLQLYWIDKARMLNKQEFDHVVYRSLHEVSKRLKDKEVKYYIQEDIAIKSDSARGNYNNGNARLGVGVREIDEKTIAEANLHNKSGLLVEHIQLGSLAWKAGIDKGDIITSVNNEGVRSVQDIRQALQRAKNQDSYQLTVQRESKFTYAQKVQQLFNQDLAYRLELADFSSPKPIRYFNKNQMYINAFMNDSITNAFFDCDQEKIYNRFCSNSSLIFNTQQMVLDMVVRVMTDNDSALEKVCKFDLESIIHEEFKDSGIKSSPQWAVNDSKRGIISNSGNFDNNQRVQYKVPLFENEFLQESAYLSVYFPAGYAETRFLSSGTALSAFAFILVIIACFYYTINLLISQKKISELKSDFINNMTHELKTPVSSIKLASDLMLDDSIPKTPEKTRRFMGIIRQENERLGSQIEKVLQIAKVEKGEEKLHLEKLDVNSILQNILNRSVIQIEQNNGKLEKDLHAENAYIEADRVHLTNVLTNLLDNAIKYTPETPVINVSTRNEKDSLIVAFKDNGIGMSSEVQKRIFEKFYREPTGNLHNVKGFGLGLSYVKHMIEAHGGSIRVESSKNKGSIFELQFPINKIAS